MYCSVSCSCYFPSCIGYRLVSSGVVLHVTARSEPYVDDNAFWCRSAFLASSASSAVRHALDTGVCTPCLCELCTFFVEATCLPFCSSRPRGWDGSAAARQSRRSKPTARHIRADANEVSSARATRTLAGRAQHHAVCAEVQRRQRSPGDDGFASRVQAAGRGNTCN